MAFKRCGNRLACFGFNKPPGKCFGLDIGSQINPDVAGPLFQGFAQCWGEGVDRPTFKAGIGDN